MKVMRNALMKDPEVIQEVNRYKWIESERLGTDVGFDAAVAIWLDLHADQWVKLNKSKSFNLFFRWIWSQLTASLRK